MKQKQRKFIHPNITIRNNPNKHLPRIIPTHLHQNKTHNTYTHTNFTIMSKIYIIWMNQKHKLYIWTLSATRNTSYVNKIHSYYWKISNLIRSGTQAVRLTANMTAGCLVFNAIPSLRLLYLVYEVHNPIFTLKAVDTNNIFKLWILRYNKTRIRFIYSSTGPKNKHIPPIRYR